MDIVEGITRGIHWYELPLDHPGMEHLLPRAQPNPQATKVAVVRSPNRPPTRASIASLLSKALPSASVPGDRLTGLSGSGRFRPFDEIADFPNHIVVYENSAFHGFDFDGWMHQHFEIPKHVDLTFTVESYPHRYDVTARTSHGGRIHVVRKKLDPGMHFGAALAMHMPYLSKNCPAPPTDDAGAVTCGPHVLKLLESLTGAGRGMVQRWAVLCAAAPAGGRDVEALSIPVTMLPGVADLKGFSLRPSRTTDAVEASVTWRTGHELRDDDKGVTINLSAALPDTILAGLAGRTVADVIGADWGGELVIRTARAVKGGAVLRAAAPGRPFALKAPSGDDAAVSRADLEARLRSEDPNTDWIKHGHVHEAAGPVLRSLDTVALSAVLGTLETQSRVDLTPYGRPGWTLRRQGWDIIPDESPKGSIADVARAALLRGSQGPEDARHGDPD